MHLGHLSGRANESANTAEGAAADAGEVDLGHAGDVGLLNRGVHLDLTKVGVPPVLMVRKHSNLHKERAHGVAGRISSCNVDPTSGLVQVYGLKLLQVVKAAAHADGDPIGGVTLVELVISVDAYSLDCGLAPKLNVHKVWLRPVRLPIGVQTVVSQLVNAKPWFARRQRPHGLSPNFPDLSFPLQTQRVADVARVHGSRIEWSTVLART